jgi:hypothetical protein
MQQGDRQIARAIATAGGRYSSSNFLDLDDDGSLSVGSPVSLYGDHRRRRRLHHEGDGGVGPARLS